MSENNKVIPLHSWPRPISQRTTKEIIQKSQEQRKEELKNLNKKWLNRLADLD